MRLVWKDRDGKLLSSFGPPADGIRGVAISPDGKYVAAAVLDYSSNGEDIWIYETERGIPTRLTFDKMQKGAFTWSADGKWLYYAVVRSGRSGVFRKAANGAGGEEKIADGFLFDISPDGKSLLSRRGSGVREELTALTLDSAEGAAKPEPRLFLKSTGEIRSARFSPDGRWVVYSSDESGAFHIYAAPFPDANGKRQVTRTPSIRAQWSRNGKEIFYVEHSGGQLMAVDVAVRNGSLEIGEARKLIDGNFIGAASASGPIADVSTDGRKLLA